MRLQILLAGAAVSLAACGQPAPGGNTATTATTTTANTSTPAAPVAVKVPPRIPGEWEYVTKVELLDVQGGPPGLAAQMQKSSPATTRRECMSKEQAEEDISKAVQKDQGGCRFERVETVAGSIAGTAICSNGGMEATGKMNGTVKPTAIDMIIDMTMKLPSPGTAAPAEMKMRMTMAGKRVGDCPK
ncbi:MAG: DUF3617 domain-containing protein [Pseudomonadota bacterium]